MKVQFLYSLSRLISRVATRCVIKVRGIHGMIFYRRYLLQTRNVNAISDRKPAIQDCLGADPLKVCNEIAAIRVKPHKAKIHLYVGSFFRVLLAGQQSLPIRPLPTRLRFCLLWNLRHLHLLRRLIGDHHLSSIPQLRATRAGRASSRASGAGAKEHSGECWGTRDRARESVAGRSVVYDQYPSRIINDYLKGT